MSTARLHAAFVMWACVALAFITLGILTFLIGRAIDHTIDMQYPRTHTPARPR